MRTSAAREQLSDTLPQVTSLLDRKDANGRYVALETLATVASAPDIAAALRPHLPLVLHCLADADPSVKKRTVDVLVTVCDAESVPTIVSQLLEHLAVRTPSHRPPPATAHPQPPHTSSTRTLLATTHLQHPQPLRTSSRCAPLRGPATLPRSRRMLSRRARLALHICCDRWASLSACDAATTAIQSHQPVSRCKRRATQGPLAPSCWFHALQV